MKFLKRPNIIIAILFTYTTCMFAYFFPRNHEMSNSEKWTIVCISYLILVVLWFLLNRREKLRQERENDMNNNI